MRVVFRRARPSTAIEPLTADGRSARASRQPGSARAKASIPAASMVVISDEPPEETKGSGTPMIGSVPITAPILMMACTRIHTITPDGRNAHEEVVGSHDEAIRGIRKDREKGEHDERADQAQLFTDDGEDEVVVRLREPLPLLLARAQTDPGHAAVGQGELSVQRLAANAVVQVLVLGLADRGG